MHPAAPPERIREAEVLGCEAFPGQGSESLRQRFKQRCPLRLRQFTAWCDG